MCALGIYLKSIQDLVGADALPMGPSNQEGAAAVPQPDGDSSEI